VKSQQSATCRKVATVPGWYPLTLTQSLTVRSLDTTASSGFRKKSSPRASAQSGPIRGIVFSLIKLFSNFLNARNFSCVVFLDQPIPKGEAEIEAVVPVLGLDEDVCIEEIIGHFITPTLRPSLLKFSVLETPSIRKASDKAFALRACSRQAHGQPAAHACQYCVIEIAAAAAVLDGSPQTFDLLRPGSVKALTSKPVHIK